VSHDTERLVIASYNVHRCVGADGRQELQRVARVLAELGADVIGLQEVDDGRAGNDQLAGLARLSGFAWLRGPTLQPGAGLFGNGLLTRLPVRNARLIDLSHPGCEPRGAIDAEIACSRGWIRVVVTHLGLGADERRHQSGRLLERMRMHAGFDVSVLLGDFNEWWAPAWMLRRMHRFFGETRAVRSFPASAPMLALDRVWVKPAPALAEVRAHRSALSRVASDHLPVRAVIELPGAGLGNRGDHHVDSPVPA